MTAPKSIDASFSSDERQLIRRLAPVLAAVQRLPADARQIIAIDGPCGSGKTTIAHLLSQLLNAPCVHMDDFHIPHAMKTQARLAEPGGNSDRERLIHEVILPWKQGRTGSYRPYDCMNDCLSAPVLLPDSGLLILEGSYSHHPDIAAYTDLQIFVQVERNEQLRRLSHRCPEKLPMFLSRWIPLEDAYFSAFGLPSADALLIDNVSVHGM